jgi:hypothetical protein
MSLSTQGGNAAFEVGCIAISEEQAKALSETSRNSNAYTARTDNHSEWQVRSSARSYFRVLSHLTHSD